MTQNQVIKIAKIFLGLVAVFFLIFIGHRCGSSGKEDTIRQNERQSQMVIEQLRKENDNLDFERNRERDLRVASELREFSLQNSLDSTLQENQKARRQRDREQAELLRTLENASNDEIAQMMTESYRKSFPTWDLLEPLVPEIALSRPVSIFHYSRSQMVDGLNLEITNLNSAFSDLSGISDERLFRINSLKKDSLSQSQQRENLDSMVVVREGQVEFVKDKLNKRNWQLVGSVILNVGTILLLTFLLLL
jgi:hypothetical protein